MQVKMSTTRRPEASSEMLSRIALIVAITTLLILLLSTFEFIV